MEYHHEHHHKSHKASGHPSWPGPAVAKGDVACHSQVSELSTGAENGVLQENVAVLCHWRAELTAPPTSKVKVHRGRVSPVDAAEGMYVQLDQH